MKNFCILGILAMLMLNDGIVFAAPKKDHKSTDYLVKLNTSDISRIERQAHMAIKTADYEKAEKFYLELINSNLSREKRRSVLLEMAEAFKEAGQASKVVTIYEKFAEEFPQDSLLPKIFIDLGRTYRKMGVNVKALGSFYKVLNMSLKIPEADMQEYKELTIVAQLEIIETHFLEKDYENTERFLVRLKDTNLSHNDRVSVDFRYSQIPVLQKQYTKAVPRLTAFIAKYPKSSYIPEAHYLLATSYKDSGDADLALDQVLKLMKHEDLERNASQEEIDNWKIKAGNVVGGQFYDQGDYFSALQIYQAMAKISEEPKFQWPVIYQIGLCFERLRMPQKAIEAYELLVNPDKKPKKPLSNSLVSLQESSRWRMEQLNTIKDIDQRLQNLLFPEPKPVETKTES